MNTAENTQIGMKSRMYTPEDYTTLEKWWIDQKWSPVPKDMLPTLGIIMTMDGKDICAGFLYTSNSPTGWMEWVIANPESDKTIRSEALNELVDNLLMLAKLKKCKYIVTSVMHPKLIERLETKGFIKTDQAMTNMVKVLGEL